MAGKPCVPCVHVHHDGMTTSGPSDSDTCLEVLHLNAANRVTQHPADLVQMIEIGHVACCSSAECGPGHTSLLHRPGD